MRGSLRHQDATLRLLAPEYQALPAPKTRKEANQLIKARIYENLDLMEQQLFAAINLIRQRIGILSLTARYDSLPMWAHYAKQAHGFVVRLENLEQAFAGDATGSLNVLKRVRYAKQFLGMTYDPSTQDRLFFSKLSDWTYEREWRVVTDLSACQFYKESNLYLKNVSPKHITGVICGWRVPASEVSALRSMLAEAGSNASVVSAALNQGQVAIDNIEIWERSV